MFITLIESFHSWIRHRNEAGSGVLLENRLAWFQGFSLTHWHIITILYACGLTLLGG